MPVSTINAQSALSYPQSVYKIIDQQQFNEIYECLADFIENKINPNDLRIRLNDALIINH